jgi:hypothetical protein
MSEQPATRTLPADLASKFAGLALEHLRREYPNKLDHVIRGSADLRPPHELHPVFYGSFDWHSNVHAYWMLATLVRHAPDVPECRRIREVFDVQLTAQNIAAELAYVNQPGRETFERPYGWAWLLMLAAELERNAGTDGRRWAAALRPLALAFVVRFKEFLPKATYPVRAGTHFNTAFALALAFEYAEAAADHDFLSLIREKAVGWYGADVDCQAWEPGGDDFLSPALVEAECMRRILSLGEWTAWMGRFLPRIAKRDPPTLFHPVVVSDRRDGKIAHLDGLNLSRAWCWRGIASSWRVDDPRRAIALDCAEQHLSASLPYVAGEYAGEHWLATYALLAMLVGEGVRAF